MYLVADIGNTNVCLAVFHGQTLRCAWRFPSNQHLTPKGWKALIEKKLFEETLSWKEMQGFLVSCVVPPLLEIFEAFGQEIFGEAFGVVGQGKAAYPHKALIDRPGEAGADLMVNAFAAHHLYGGPLFIVDFGTATTFSRIDDQGNFCGVAIAPGLNLAADALFAGAANLFRLSFEKPQRVIGTNTQDSVRSGLFWGYLGLVEGLLERAFEEHRPLFASQTPLVIATGGLGETFSKETPLITKYEPDLTLRGLGLLYQKMQKETV